MRRYIQREYESYYCLRNVSGDLTIFIHLCTYIYKKKKVYHVVTETEVNSVSSGSVSCSNDMNNS